MNNLTNNVIKAEFINGYIYINMNSGVEIKFPIKNNKRLSQASDQQLSKIEISPFGIHFTELDEDLSFRGLLKGEYGQQHKNNPQHA